MLGLLYYVRLAFYMLGLSDVGANKYLRSNYTLVFNDHQGKSQICLSKMALAESDVRSPEVAVNLILEANKVEPENILVLLRLFTSIAIAHWRKAYCHKLVS